MTLTYAPFHGARDEIAIVLSVKSVEEFAMKWDYDIEDEPALLELVIACRRALGIGE